MKMEKANKCIFCGSPACNASISKIPKINRLHKLWKDECAETVCHILFAETKRSRARTLIKHFKTADFCTVCLQRIRDVNILWKLQKTLQRKISKYLDNTKVMIKSNYDNMLKTLAESSAECPPEEENSNLKNYNALVKVVYQESWRDFSERFETSNKENSTKMEETEVENSVDLDDEFYSNNDYMQSPFDDSTITSDFQDQSEEMEVEVEFPLMSQRFTAVKIPCKTKGCRRKFLFEAEMEAHYVFCKEEKKPSAGMNCPHCDRFLKNESYLKEHIQRMHEERFRCKLCGKIFQTADELENHESNFHQGTNPFACAFCETQCLNSTELKKHTVEVHPDPDMPKCRTCGKVFETLHGLMLHERFHDDPSKLKKCDICEKLFPNRHQLKRHVDTHNTEVSFLCNICGKGFTNKKNLGVHIRTHDPNRRYYCKICGKSFKSVTGLRSHETSHTEMKPFTCSICGKTFLNKYNMLTHEKIHTGDNVKRVRVRKQETSPQQNSTIDAADCIVAFIDTNDPHGYLPSSVDKVQ